MSVCQHLAPQKVLYYFEQLCAIPHGSGNTKAASDYCVSFAKSHGLRYKQDSYNNVIIYKDASTGYEQAPTVILQGHLDMVCVKTADCKIDFLRDGLTLAVDGDYLHAVGTSLGGDDGIAVAIALAVLDDDTLPHPPLEALLTVDEETCMDGAMAVDFADLKGRRLINLDSEEEGVITAGCAGGVRVICRLPLHRQARQGVRCTLSVSGLLGGHSGTEIHRQRGNANVLLGRVLYAMLAAAPYGIAALHGGTVDNAIAVKAEAELLASAADIKKIADVAASYQAIFSHEYADTDAGVSVMFTQGEAVSASATSDADNAELTFALLTMPNGVQFMSAALPGLTQTSLNMGVLDMTGDKVEMVVCVRSSIGTQKQWLCQQLESIMRRVGGSIELVGDYPAWEYKADSKLLALTAEAYRSLFGKTPAITATHGGLECGLFCGKASDLDCVSLGPELRDIHSPRERLGISSTERLYRLITEILKNAIQ